MDAEKPDIYSKSIKKEELIEYIEKLEWRLSQHQKADKKIIPWIFYLIFLFSFLAGGAVFSVGINNLKGQSQDAFIFITLLVVISPIFYMLYKDSK